VPHNFVKINAVTSNPGRRTCAEVASACERHGGTFERLWFDDPDDPTFAYVLVKDGNLDGILDALRGREVLRLFEAEEIEVQT
jgi:hypothetical protein